MRLPSLSAGLRLVTTSAAVLGAGYLIRESNGLRTALGASWRRKASTLPASDHFDGKTFHNLLPSQILSAASAPALMKAMIEKGSIGKPSKPVPLVESSLPGPAADLAITWLGHASVLLEIDGVRVLADPVWSDRVSPSQHVGPKRLHPVPIKFADIPALDAVVISHDHYDHLDLGTVELIRDQHTAPFVVPLGVGDHLRTWGVPDDRVIELDWDEHHQIKTLTLTCVQAQHFSGRNVQRNDTLWSSWALAGPQHRVFFGGDTGYTPAFADAGEKYGPFDVTLVPIGAYDSHWADIHLDPEEAVRTHLDVKGAVLIPIHWATFDLAMHAWSEPVVRLLAEARRLKVPVLIPRPGLRITSLSEELDDPWWESV